MCVEEQNSHAVRRFFGRQRLDADSGIARIVNDYYITRSINILISQFYFNYATKIQS